MRKLLIVGTNSIHTFNYIDLVTDFFDDILLLTDKINDKSELRSIEIDFSLKPQNLLKTPKKIRKIVEDYDPTVVHIHQANSVAFHTNLSGISKKYKTILTAWGSDILVLPKNSWLLKKMVQFNLNTADFFTSDSSFMAQEMKKLSKKPIEVLVANFGINVDIQDVPKENIIYSNRLHKKLYNVDKIISAFDVFQQQNPGWKLVIAATGEETEKLKQQVEELKLKDHISFVGWVDKKVNSTWYSKAKIWVSIPDSDATSISLLEAMACGCLPIVSDLPATREWVFEGDNGIIVKEYEPNFFSRALSCDLTKAVDINIKRIEKDGLKSANRLKFIKLYEEALKMNHNK